MVLQGLPRRAIASGIAILIIVIIVAAVGVGGFFLVNDIPSGSNLNSNSTDSSSTISSSASISQSSDVAYSSTSTNSYSVEDTTSSGTFCPSYLSNLTSTEAGNNTFNQFAPGTFINELLGNFSQMTMKQFTSVQLTVNNSLLGLMPNSSTMSESGSLPASFNETTATLSSYSLVGEATINNTVFHIVNYTENIATSYGSENESGTIYFNLEGNATLLRSGSSTYTGLLAESQAEGIMLAFEIPLIYADTIGASVPLSALTLINQSTVNLAGGHTLDVTNYRFALDSATLSNCINSYNNGTSTNALGNLSEVMQLQVGKLPGTNEQILTFLEISGSSQQLGESTEIYQLLSYTGA